MRSIAASRPDVKDQIELERFATQIAARNAVGFFKEVKMPGNKPYKEFKGVPMKPFANEACIKCGACAAKCPVGAIPQDAPNETDNSLCITCMRCVQVCPVKARGLADGVEASVAQWLKPLCEGRKENKLFI